MKRILTIIAVVAIGLAFFTSCESSIEENGEGKHEGHEYVDLGLPSGLKWATCNVGATKPEKYGDYFAWGEVEPKKQYDWTTYLYCKGTNKTLTKYCNNSSYGEGGFTDAKTVLDPEDDAATINWGGRWRMPTKAEQDELRTKCTWDWTTQNGVNGYKVTGPNGNSIFLPAAGYMNEGTLYLAGSYGYYWSTLLGTSGPDNAYHEGFGSGSENYHYRYRGQSVRPVYGVNNDNLDKNEYTITVSSNDSSYGFVSGGGTYEEGTSVTLTATANSGYKFKEWNDGNTDNPRVITVTQDESYTAYFEKEETMNAVHEFVDLGLPSGLKWATCNVGATKPEEYGNYFAWGEVEPKTTYNLDTYKYYDGSYFTKYTGSDKTELDPEDDVAAVNWGGAWRMPTKAEQDELRDNCTWTWTTQNGVNGYKVTGPNGNSIFLPAAGRMYKDTLDYAGSKGYYRSSSLDTDDLSCVYYVYFYSDNVSRATSTRSYGLVVRPVCQ